MIDMRKVGACMVVRVALTYAAYALAILAAVILACVAVTP